MQSKRKILTAAASFIAIGLVFVGLVLYPIFQGVLQDRDTIVEQREELLEIKEGKARFGEFESVSARYEKQFQEVNALFIDQQTPIAFFRFLDDTAAEFSLDIEKTPDDPEHIEGDAWPSAKVRLAGSGRYVDVFGFLKKIENAPYVVHVTNVSIREKPKNPEDIQQTVAFSMTIKFFVQ